MKRTLLVAGLLLLAVAPSFAQSPTASKSHVVGGVFIAPAYAGWQAQIISGNTGTGAGTSIIVTAPGPLPDGSVLPITTFFNTSTPISINDANAEIFTPSGVTIGTCPAGNLGVGGSSVCATVTGTIANTHGQSALVGSGDNGIEEAIVDAGANGGGPVYWLVDTGLVTLNTGGLTTTSTTKIPTNFINFGAAAKVTTTITTSTNWAVGISGATSAFCSVNTVLTAGSTCLATQVNPISVGTTSALTAVLITVTGANAGAGVVKARLWGYTAVQATN